jgi:D-alanyl-D-alanine carboxypeptidase (penicillin-binding protein 5/6)
MAFVVALLCGYPAVSLAEAAEEIPPAQSALENCMAAVLIETSSGQVLKESDADVLHDVAGLTKLPGLLVICEAVERGLLNAEADITVSEKAAKTGGPTAFVETGETIKAAPLLKAAIMISAGDAIVALGEHIYGTEAAFVDAINTRLKALGIDIQLSDAVGSGTQFDAASLARVGAATAELESFKIYSTLMLDGITHADGRKTELANPNRMVRNYAGCDGVMTGSSPADGYAGVFSVSRGDMRLVAVVIGSKKSAERFAAAKTMLDEAFASMRAQKLSTRGEVLYEGVKVKGGNSKTVNLIARDTIVLLLDKAEPSLMAERDIPGVLTAPIGPDEVVGSIVYKTDTGEVRGRVELVVDAEITAYALKDIISSILKNFIRI